VKQKIHPVAAALLAVVAVTILGLLGYRVFTAAGSSSEPKANPRPTNPEDERYKSHLPPGVGGGGS